MDRLDLLPVVLAVGVVVVRVHAHRAGAVERADRDDVVEHRGLHAAQQVAHGPAVQLEHAERVAAGEELVGFLVLDAQGVEVDVDPAVGLDVVDRVTDDRQVPQAQEVHLQQADGFARRVVPAGDDRAVVTLPERDRVGQRVARHDDRAGVHARVADQAFETAGGVEDRLALFVRLDQRADLGGLAEALVLFVDDARERDVLRHDRRRQRLGDLVRDRVTGLAEVDPRRVLDRGLGLNGAEGDDLSDLVDAVLVGRVPDHLAA